MFKIQALPIEKLDFNRISSPYGMRMHPIQKKMKMHDGIDLAYPMGTRIYAVADGRVVYSRKGNGVGEYITIYHGDGVYSIYEHMKVRAKYAEQTVRAGEYIGQVGSTGDSTGPHLHFGLCTNYVPTDITLSKWFDPMPFLEEFMITPEKITVSLNGKDTKISALNKDGRYFLAVRELADADLSDKFSVDWDEVKKKVILTTK